MDGYRVNFTLHVRTAVRTAGRLI